MFSATCQDTVSSRRCFVGGLLCLTEYHNTNTLLLVRRLYDRVTQWGLCDDSTGRFCFLKARRFCSCIHACTIRSPFSVRTALSCEVDGNQSSNAQQDERRVVVSHVAYGATCPEVVRAISFIRRLQVYFHATTFGLAQGLPLSRFV